MIYAPRTRAGHLPSFQMYSRETPFTTRKETFQKTGCRELTEETLQSGELECCAGLSWTSAVNVSQTRFPPL